MMHITIVAVGRLKERFWTDACAEYLKRLGAYADVKVHELADVDPAKSGGQVKAIATESQAIVKAIPADAAVVLMDIKGKSISSEEIAAEMERFALEGTNSVCLVIGGSCGVNDDVRARAQRRWSLGRITLPHNLARVVVLEQLYRAFKITRGEPYHK